jgi:hypothetical protein
MNTFATTAAVTGARHLRVGRNGQDAAAAWLGDDAVVVAVCDGCSSGASSEVGARLGVRLFVHALSARLRVGDAVRERATWEAARADVASTLAELLERMRGDRIEAIHEHFLFTIAAAAVTRDGAAVWLLGDGMYSFGDRTRIVGPFEDNAPPYLAYDLVGDAREACFEVAPAGATSIVVATDGASDLALETFASSRFVEHPDALRRHLAVLARAGERIDWEERRVVRTPAVVQDDCAVGVLHWRLPS